MKYLMVKFLITENYILSDPELKSNVIDLSYLSHKEKYEESIRRATIVLRKVRKLQSEGWNENDLYRFVDKTFSRALNV